MSILLYIAIIVLVLYFEWQLILTALAPILDIAVSIFFIVMLAVIIVAELALIVIAPAALLLGSGIYAAKLAKNIRRQDDGYSIEVKDRAWELFKKHPNDNSRAYDHGSAESLEDLPDDVAAYYLDWAKRSTLETKDES